MNAEKRIPPHPVSEFTARVSRWDTSFHVTHFSNILNDESESVLLDNLAENSWTPYSSHAKVHDTFGLPVNIYFLAESGGRLC